MESKAKTTVTFHSGILTIGGTVIEVAYKDAHIFFDFGTEFRPELDLPDDHIETLINKTYMIHVQVMNIMVQKTKTINTPLFSYLMPIQIIHA